MMSRIDCFHKYGEFNSYIVEVGRSMRLDLEIRHLKLIVAVAEEGTVTKASHRLHLTQSALSHQLRDIENKLGATLFLRANKKMTLTPAGERLLASAHRLLYELKRVEDEVRQIASDQQATLRLSTECYTCYHWLPSLLKVFNRKFPRVSVEIDVAATRQPIQALLSGKIDLAIVSTPIRDSRLLTKPLFQDELLVVMKPDHPLASRPYIRAKDFAEEKLFVYALPKEENTVFQKVLIPAGIEPKQFVQVELTEAIVEMVKAGLGISVLAQWAVAPQIKTGALSVRPLTSKGLRRQWSGVTLKNQMHSKYALEFINSLADKSLAGRLGAIS
jgi:LysR family transcriptional regulator for metE and metH